MPGSRRVRVVSMGLLAAALLIVGIGAQATTVTLQEDDGGGDASSSSIVTRLAQIEDQLPAMPPEEITFLEEDAGLTGIIAGDFIGAQVALEAVADDLRDLFETAADVRDADGEAVADVARGWLQMRQGYELLAAYEINDLEFPVGTFEAGDGGVATGADDARGQLRAGFRVLLDAYERMTPAYGVLRDSGAASDAEKQIFEDRYRENREFDLVTRAQIHRLLGFETTQEVLPISRFETSAPGTEARARLLEIVCIDSDTYEALTSPTGVPTEALDNLEIFDVAIDCPDLPVENEVRPQGP